MDGEHGSGLTMMKVSLGGDRQHESCLPDLVRQRALPVDEAAHPIDWCIAERQTGWRVDFEQSGEAVDM